MGCGKFEDILFFDRINALNTIYLSFIYLRLKNVALFARKFLAWLFPVFLHRVQACFLIRSSAHKQPQCIVNNDVLLKNHACLDITEAQQRPSLAARFWAKKEGHSEHRQAGRSGPKVAETLLREQCILGPKPGCARGEASPVPPLNAGNLRAVLPNLGGLVA